MFVENERNFVLKHREYPSKTIQVAMRETFEGDFEWDGLPEVLKQQLNVFSNEEV